MGGKWGGGGGSSCVKVFFSIGRATKFKMRRYTRKFRKYYIVVRTGRKRASKEFRRFR